MNNYNTAPYLYGSVHPVPVPIAPTLQSFHVSPTPLHSTNTNNNSNVTTALSGRNMYSPAYSLLTHANISVHNPLPPPVSLLPSNFFDSVTNPEFKYRFQVELECIARIHDEKKAESEQKELEAWKALEQKRIRKPSNALTSSSTNPDTLIDLTFATSDTPPPTLSHRDQLCSSLLSKGYSPDLIDMAIDILGIDDERKILSYLSNFYKLEHEHKYARSMVQQAMLLYEGDYKRSLEFLKECEILMKLHFKNEEIMSALQEHSQDIVQASGYLQGYKMLRDLGFEDVKVKESLVMTNNDKDKAIQYLLDNS